MTSQINPNNIDGTYPVAGQDNDSQGFRDNFTNLRNNLTFAKAEIEDLQNKAVLKSALLNTTLSNDLLGNAIVSPRLTSWRETFYNNGTQSGAVPISFTNGNYQKITLSGTVQLTFSFPTNTQNSYSSIKLWISNPSSAFLVQFPATLTLGDPDTVTGFSGQSITFTAAEIANTNDYFFEIFTFDGGTTLGIKDLTRNRDFFGNIEAQFGGEMVVEGNVRLGNVINSTVGANVVVRSDINSTSSTTGALVVRGGAGIASNVHINGNLWVNSGNIRTNGSVANIFNVSATTVSLGNAATNIFVGASTGDVRIAGNIVAAGNIISSSGTGGRINQNFAYVTLTDGQMFFANTNFSTLFFDTASSATIANAWIAFPAAAEDGREIQLSFHAPITGVWVSYGPGGSMTDVKWFPNTSVSSGNVSARFIYSTAASNWLRSE